jgi:bifunctional non-homologous end joining protein LigD
MVSTADRFGADSKPSFNACRPRSQGTQIERAVRESPCVLACFDLLHFAGMNLRKAAYRDRTRWLAQAFLPIAHIQRIESSPDGERLYRASLDAGFEGVMAKRLSSCYEPGTRSNNWVKIKAVQSDEFYIGGYAEGRGNRAERFGSLLVGTPTKGKKLKYAGRVGTGFDERLLNDLKKRFDKLKTDQPPFTAKPPVDRPTTWLKLPVAEVKFASGPDGYLRAPVFLRLREDTAQGDKSDAKRDPKRSASRRVGVTNGGAARGTGRQKRRRRRARRAPSLTNLNRCCGKAKKRGIAPAKRDFCAARRVSPI